MLLLYRIAIFFYGFLIQIFSIWNSKARKFSEGRKGIIDQLALDIKGNEQLIWMHVASLGEFEQGRPVIEALKAQNPDQKILLTFFSPSGYEIRKNYDLADWVYYLPIDTPRNAEDFIESVKPRLAIFVKYEFWYFFLKGLTDRGIPTLIISAIFRKNQYLLNWKGSFYRPILRKISYYFVQDETSKKLLQPYSQNVTVTGDTRFDRVTEIAAQAKKYDIVESFLGGADCFVIGSSWPSDIKVIAPFINQYRDEIKFIIAPHNIKEEEIADVQATFGKSTRYSKPENLSDSSILIIDNIGMLSSLYKYATYAYIGGGFRGALHNTVEAAVYGIPIFFGRHEKNRKFKEAIELEEFGAAFPISNLSELMDDFARLKDDPERYKKSSEASYDYVKSKTGATREIMSKINEIL